MKRLYNSLKIAFSMYSKIPMPKSDWTKENMRYMLCFFPWVGIVIGLVSYGVWKFLMYLQTAGYAIGQPFITVVMLLIPIVITGGIHLDGLLDTSDALSSYQERERRLEILKDSHAGAFAIIVCATYFLFYYGVYTQLDTRSVVVISIGFVLSRTLSALSIVSFPLAKGTGLAATFSDGAQKRTVKITMAIYFLLLVLVMVCVGGILGIVASVMAIAVFIYYYLMSMKNFGGITGDLAGYFLQICELAMAFAVVVASVVTQGYSA